MNLKLMVFLILILCPLLLFSLPLPTPPGDIYHYDNSDPKTCPIWSWFVQGPDTFSSEVRIGDIKGDLKKQSPIFNLQNIEENWTLTGILRFYGESEYDSATDKSKRFSWDMFSDDECTDLNCSYRNSYTAHGSKKHYWRWDGIFDEEHLNSKNVTENTNHQVWNKIKYNLKFTAPDGTSQILISPTTFKDSSVSLNKYAAAFCDFPATKDLGFTIKGKNHSIVFPISFQDCKPDYDEGSKINAGNSYLLEFQLQYPYAYWNTQIPGQFPDTQITDVSLFKTRVFVWDSTPPKIKDLSFPKFFTTGDPVPETMEFTVSDDNPNQELEEIIVTIGDQTFTKSGGDIAVKESRNIDITSTENYIANCKFKFSVPPDRQTALSNPQDYYIAPYDFETHPIMTIEGKIEVSVKHGVNEIENSFNQENSLLTEEAIFIPIVDNDPPTVEIKFAETREDLKQFFDSSQIPSNKKACSVEIGPSDANYHLDLDNDQTPIPCKAILYGSGKEVEYLFDNYTATRDPLHSPGIAAEVISIDLSTKNDIKIVLVEDKRYYFGIRVFDNVSRPSEINVFLKKEGNSSTLNLSGASSVLVPIETTKSNGDTILNPIMFTQALQDSSLIIHVEDKEKNALEVKIPFNVIKYSVSHTTIR